MEEFYTQLQKHGGNVERTLPTIRRGPLDASCVNEVLQSCSIDRSFLGLRFFIWAGTQSSYRHSKYMYSRACKMFMIDQNPRVIMDVFDLYKAEGYSVSAKTVKVVLNLCKEAKRANEALWVLRKMDDFNVGADTADYNIVITLFAEKGDTDTAENLLDEMGSKGVYPNMLTFVQMIRGFCNVGKLEDACWLFKVMKEKGCVPNVVVVSALLDGICQFGNLERAMGILSEMEKVGGDCTPNVITYTSIIQSFCNRGLAIKAMKVFDRMMDSGCSPNTVTVSTLVDSLCKEDHVQEAYKLIDRIVSSAGVSVSNGKCYSSLVISLTRLKKLDDAVKLFRNMLTSEMRPDSLACSVIIRELCSKGNYLESFNLYYEVEKMGHILTVDSDLFSILLAGLCRLHHTDEATTVARLMLCKGIRAVAPCDDNVLCFLKNCGESELVVQLSKLVR